MGDALFGFCPFLLVRGQRLLVGFGNLVHTNRAFLCKRLALGHLRIKALISFDCWNSAIINGSAENFVITARLLSALAWLVSFAILIFSGRDWRVLIPFVFSTAFLIDASGLRSDFIALPFVLGLIVSFEAKEWSRKTRVFSVFCVIVAMLITPKSALLILAVLPFIKPRDTKFFWQLTSSVIAGGIIWMFLKPELASALATSFTAESWGAEIWSQVDLHSQCAPSLKIRHGY